MLPETKSNRTSRPDVIMAYRTLSGYCLGTWLRRARLCSGLGTDWQTCHRPLFSHQDGTRWDSSYFRTTYVYPSLRQQQAAGDSYLQAFNGSPGNSIEEKFGPFTATGAAPAPMFPAVGSTASIASAGPANHKYTSMLVGAASVLVNG
jgi:hypothetical protein